MLDYEYDKLKIPKKKEVSREYPSLSLHIQLSF